jgi:hypothetical protein
MLYIYYGFIVSRGYEFLCCCFECVLWLYNFLSFLTAIERKKTAALVVLSFVRWFEGVLSA